MRKKLKALISIHVASEITHSSLLWLVESWETFAIWTIANDTDAVERLKGTVGSAVVLTSILLDFSPSRLDYRVAASLLRLSIGGAIDLNRVLSAGNGGGERCAARDHFD